MRVLLSTEISDFLHRCITRDLTELLLWGTRAAGNQETTVFLLTESPFGDHSLKTAA